MSIEVTHYVLGYLNPYGEWWYFQRSGEIHNGRFLTVATTRDLSKARRVAGVDHAERWTKELWGFWQVIAEPVHEIISFK